MRLEGRDDDDTEHEIGDICCCDLPTMTKLYYTKGNIRELSPFLDADNMFPELLKQCRIEGKVCGIPVLMFAGSAGTAESEAAGTADAEAPQVFPADRTVWLLHDEKDMIRK